jgi:DNA modification methylase
MKLDTNLIYCGDNLEVLAKFPEKSVDLIYADPPFFSNKYYEIIWGNGAEMKVYEDRWKGGINVYIEWMKDRLFQCHRVLKDTGSMYLHCDWHATHRLRVAMDDIFGEKNFINEIIWFYRGGGASKKRFARKHETILLYTKGKEWTFNLDAVRTPYSPDVLRSLPSRYDKSYRRNKVYSGYKPHPLGKIPDDVWIIQPIMPSDKKERLGYPTQKPEALLKRIVEASSNKGDIVLDPFCGGGTTIAVAHKLGRKWIGIDVSPIACNKMKDRLNKVGATNVRIIGAPKTIDELKQLSDWQFQNWVIERIGGVPSSKRSDDKGVDGYTFMAREPVQVKQSEDVGRNVVDNFETAMRRKHKATGYIVAFSFGKGAYEEAARAKLEDNLDIKLVRVDELDKYF